MRWSLKIGCSLKMIVVTEAEAEVDSALERSRRGGDARGESRPGLTAAAAAFGEGRGIGGTAEAEEDQ